MIKALELAKRIAKRMDESNIELLESYNLHKQFAPLYEMGTQETPVSEKTINTIICAIIYAYDKDSNWYDLRKESYEDKLNILKGLDADLDNEYVRAFLNLSKDEINEAIGEYLQTQTDWRYVSARRFMDFHSSAMRQQEPEFKEGNDVDKAAKAKENFGKFLRESLNHRKLADEYIEALNKEYVGLNHRTKQDFGIEFVEKSITQDIYSWREYTKAKKEAS